MSEAFERARAGYKTWLKNGWASVSLGQIEAEAHRRYTAAAAEEGRAREWQPIETAPKDGTYLLLYCPRLGAIRGRWEPQRCHVNPKPYWTNDFERIAGVIATRGDQPTHWQSLPSAPAKAEVANEMS